MKSIMITVRVGLPFGWHSYRFLWGWIEVSVSIQEKNPEFSHTDFLGKHVLLFWKSEIIVYLHPDNFLILPCTILSYGLSGEEYIIVNMNIQIVIIIMTFSSKLI